MWDLGFQIFLETVDRRGVGSENMDRDELRKRTKQFALRIIKLASSMPSTRAGEVLGRQLLKSGTSIGANYREALRASSRKHFISITEIALREADETLYWLELLAESGMVSASRLDSLRDECSQIVAILAATVKTSKENKIASGPPRPK